MDLRHTFNENAENYDRWRPRYVHALFGDIIDFSGLHKACDALEIGIGTGQATLPFLQTGCRLTAVEPGKALAAYAKRAFRAYENFDVLNMDFESYAGEENLYDLIYSATAFHWIRADIGYPRVYRLLKPGGTAALFWNHPSVNEKGDVLHAAIQRIYQEYKPFGNAAAPGFDPRACREKIELLNHYGFVDVTLKIYHNTRTLGAKAYISLLNTYSDHSSLANDIRRKVEDGISTAIERHGGEVRIYDTIDLYMARKPF
jgi:SAM-dependent methyltransferase